jgi:hypothetical protein
VSSERGINSPDKNFTESEKNLIVTALIRARFHSANSNCLHSAYLHSVSIAPSFSKEHLSDFCKKR